eukprot:4795116-Pleurochrysis_carterae.AAC.1
MRMGAEGLEEVQKGQRNGFKQRRGRARRRESKEKEKRKQQKRNELGEKKRMRRLQLFPSRTAWCRSSPSPTASSPRAAARACSPGTAASARRRSAGTQP